MTCSASEDYPADSNTPPRSVQWVVEYGLSMAENVAVLVRIGAIYHRCTYEQTYHPAD